MLVKVTLSAAGANFAISAGQEIELEALAALVGNGVENFYEPFEAEKTVLPEAEVPEVIADLETAVLAPAPERRGRRR